MTPEQRTLRSSIAAHAQWKREADPTARTAKARAGFMARFEREVDPDGTLDPADRARRAKHAMKQHMTALALKSSKAAAARKAARKAKGGGGRDG